MEIHELNTKALTDPAYVPFDDGTDTYKAEFNEVVENAANAAVAAADLTNNSVAFTSGDAASPTAWSSVSVITSGSTLATLFNRISTMVKNVRWLYSKLGTTDISSIGGGTVTGAISALNGKYVINSVTSESYTVESNATANLSISVTKSGYKAVGVLGITPLDTAAFAITRFRVYSDTVVSVSVFNTINGSRSSRIYVSVLYEKT